MALSSLFLEAFLSVAQTGSFTKAADRLHITQSALSQRILNLESELQTTLLIRDRAGLRMTPTGESLLRFCHAQQALEQEFLQGLAPQKGSELTGVYRIGGFSSITRSVLLPACAKILRENPILISFMTRELQDLPNLLKKSEVDLIVLDQRLSREGIETVFLGFEENLLVRSTKYSQNLDWYLDHDQNDVTTQQYLQKFGMKRKTLKRRFLDDVYGLVDGVKLGFGIAVLPRHLIEKEKDLEIMSPDQILKIPAWAHYLSQPFYTRLHTRVLEEIIEHSKERLVQKSERV